MSRTNLFTFPILMLLIGGCGSSGEKVNTDYTHLSKASMKAAPLTKTSTSEFESYLKNGLRLRLVQQDYPNYLVVEPTAEGDSRSSQFSLTNTHEIDVDEADLVKYDGQYLYHVVKDEYNDQGNVDNAIRVLRTDVNNAQYQTLAEITNDSDEVNYSELYLRDQQQQLVAVKKTEFVYWGAIVSESDWAWQSGKVEIELFDIAQPETPNQLWNIEIEGNLEGTRRVGNMLYLITRYVPNIQDINYSASSDNEKIANELLIRNTPISDLLPHYQVNNGAIRPLVRANDCFVADEVADNEGYADVITLSAIDLDTQQLTSSTCLNTNLQGIYASTESLYIGGSEFNSWLGFSQFTVLHKFSFEGDQVSYKASNTVPGYLGWNEPAFKMNEFEDHLRVITTLYSDAPDSPEHKLTILTEDGSNQLKVVSELPNEDNSAPIGKPGEELFAVRFAGERGYAVTFEQVDPLYVLDLANPESPQIAGELGIPGFSRYLHPLSDDWLLGIGYEAENGLVQGVKVELYDIRDMQTPTVQDTLVFGERGSYTEAGFDLRSVSFVQATEQRQKFALPIAIYQTADGDNYPSWSKSGLHQFELISQDNGEMQLTHVGEMIAEQKDEQTSWPSSYTGQRSVLHDDAVFYLYGNHVCTGFWGVTDSTSCPF